MDSPKCRLCGERHWGLCPGRRRDTKVLMAPESDAQLTQAISKVLGVPKTKVAERQSRWRKAHPDSHAAAQRASRASKSKPKRKT